MAFLTKRQKFIQHLSALALVISLAMIMICGFVVRHGLVHWVLGPIFVVIFTVSIFAFLNASIALPHNRD